jgi:hypothetical protein
VAAVFLRCVGDRIGCDIDPHDTPGTPGEQVRAVALTASDVEHVETGGEFVCQGVAVEMLDHIVGLIVGHEPLAGVGERRRRGLFCVHVESYRMAVKASAEGYSAATIRHSLKPASITWAQHRHHTPFPRGSGHVRAGRPLTAWRQTGPGRKTVGRLRTPSVPQFSLTVQKRKAPSRKSARPR